MPDRGRIRLGATARHRAHGEKLSQGRGIFDDAVESCVAAERDGYDFVRCYDATDFMVPDVANRPENTDFADGTDWNAAMTMEPAIAVAATRTANLGFFHGPLDAEVGVMDDIALDRHPRAAVAVDTV